MNNDDSFIFESKPEEQLVDKSEPRSRVSEFSRMVTESDDTITIVDEYRKPRPLLSQMGPLSTWVFLAFANFSFVCIEVLPWTGFFPKRSLSDRAVDFPLYTVEGNVSPWYIWSNFAVFELFFILALWAHLRTFYSDPGFIPRGYNYNIKKMTPANVSLFNYIALAKEKTEAIKSAQLTISRSGPVAKSSRLQQKAPLDDSVKKFAVIIPTDKRLSIR